MHSAEVVFFLVNDQSLWAGFGLRFPVSKKREEVREKADEERERVTGPRLPSFSLAPAGREQ